MYSASALIRAINATMPTRTSRPKTSAAAIGRPSPVIARVDERRSGPGTAHCVSGARCCWSTMIRHLPDDVPAHEQPVDVSGSLHELQPAGVAGELAQQRMLEAGTGAEALERGERHVFGQPGGAGLGGRGEDRKSTRLNSSHPSISYAVFSLKKK